MHATLSVTTLSSKGQVVIPKELRDARQWQAGMSLAVEDLPQGLLLRPARMPLFAPTQLENVVGCMKYDGPALSLEQIDKKLTAAFREKWQKGHS